MPKFLIIQTAFIGDVVLATAIIDKLHSFYPHAQIDFLLRKGNEGLLQNNPYLTNVLVWDKQEQKKRNLWRMAMQVRKAQYTHVINIHRFGTSGFITFMSGAKHKIGFDKNPFSFCYTKKVPHIISEPYAEHIMHETDRNQMLIADITDAQPAMPRLYPSETDRAKVLLLQTNKYICIAPSSVWFTKQFPVEKWVILINSLPADHTIYLLGGPGDAALTNSIIELTKHNDVKSLCGQLNFLQSAALMEGAAMNYANDSAPLHFASAVNAPVTAVYCSTVPAFGFGPLSDKKKVVEVQERLYCRPCGLHGHKVCPQGHFRCAFEISNEELLWWSTKKI